MKFIVVLAITLISAIGAIAQNADLRGGAVFVLTNQTANAVMMFSRDAKTGKLKLVDTEPTRGAGIPSSPENSSAGALVVDPSNPNVVYAVNIGSNDISVLAVESGGLKFVQKIASGGTRPISIAIHRKWLYVLNAGDTPTVTGFTIAFGGRLALMDGSTRPIVGGPTAGPAQIGFNNDGTILVVSEKMGNRFSIFPVDVNGLAQPPTASPSHGMMPFGFAFGPKDHMFVAEAAGGVPEGGAVSSYDNSNPLLLDLINGSVPNQVGGICWLTPTRDGRHMFVSSPVSDSLSSYSIGRDGSIRLLRPVAGSTGQASAPADLTLSPDDKYLYVLEKGSHTIGTWLVHVDRSLSHVGDFGIIPPGAQGIAVR